MQEKLFKGSDEHGMHGYQRLQGNQGKEFRKQKGKLKNQSMSFGDISYNDNSIPIDFD